MRRSCWFILTVFACVTALAAGFPEGKVIKVLPHLLDAKGRHTLSPSLFDRDAYQAELRKHPAKVAGIRFDVQWRAAGTATVTNVVLRVELRGTAKGQLPSEMKLEETNNITGSSHWAALKLDGDKYKEFGEVTAWRVSLWAGDELLGEQKSFLW
jgi:hypothetical protein